MNIAEKVRELVSEQMGTSEPPKDSDDFVSDLGADSLDITNLLIDAEEAFDIEIQDEEIEGLRTVGDAIALVQRKKSGVVTKARGEA